PAAVPRVAFAAPAIATSIAYAVHAPTAAKYVTNEEGGGAKKHRRMASEYSTDASFITSGEYDPCASDVPSLSRRPSQDDAPSPLARKPGGIPATGLSLESDALAEAAEEAAAFVDSLLELPDSDFFDWVTSPDVALVFA
ncbi:hypothetical protein T492DRAFT_873372, partial [Pavlovales sp. CCMP2436]